MSREAPAPALSPLGLRLFRTYCRPYFLRHFTALRVGKSLSAPPFASRTILYANHPSWWDPIVMLLLGDGPLAGLDVFAPIESAALDRYPILRRFGLFPIDATTPSGLRSFVRTAESIVDRPGSLLVITGQGRFADVRTRPAGLRHGIAHLLQRDSRRQAVPAALEYPFWDSRLPEALVGFGGAIRSVPGESPAKTTERLDAALVSVQNRLADASIARDPARFDTVAGRSRSGLSGVYGWLRRFSGKEEAARSVHR